jgi:uncharacterized membrane protein YjjB (DUF3815 family)
MHALTILAIALGVMLRLLTPKKGLSKLGAMVLGIVFMPFLIEFAEILWKGLPFFCQVTAIVVLVPSLFLLMTRVFFGKEVYHELLAHMLYGLFTSLMNTLFVIGILIGRMLFRSSTWVLCILKLLWLRGRPSAGPQNLL